MRKKLYLLSLPLVAALVGCTKEAPNPLAKVKQQLPEDVEQVSTKDEDYAQYLSMWASAVSGIDTHTGEFFFQDRVMLSAHLDVSEKQTIKAEGISATTSIKVKGDVKIGFEEVNHSTVIDHNVSLEVTDFTVHAKIPNVTQNEQTGKLEVRYMNIDLENFSCWLHYFEYGEYAMVYADLTDPAFTTALGSMYEQVLGTGKVRLNLTSYLTEIDNQRQAQEYPAWPERLLKSPLSWFLESEVLPGMSDFMENFLAVSMVLTQSGAKLGVKFEEENPSKISLVLNTTVADMIKSMGGNPKQIPVSGAFGASISVGTTHGLQGAFEDAELAFDLSAKSSGYMTMSSKGSASLSAYYDSLVTMPFLEVYDEYSKDVSGLVDMIMAYIKGSSQQQ